MWEIYAYQNADSLFGIFNAAAAIHGSGNYSAALAAVAFCGFVAALLAYAFAPEKLQGWKWLATVVLVFGVLVLPRVTVSIVDKTGGSAVKVIANVPFGMAALGSLTSTIGHTLTELFETAFQVIPGPGGLPSELTYEQHGLMFGNRLIRETGGVVFQDPSFRTDLVNFLHNCTSYDLIDGTLDPAVFSTSDDVWAAMSTPNPARFSPLTAGGSATVATCPNVYTNLSGRLPAQIARIQGRLAFTLNPTLPATTAASVIAGQIQQAYLRNRIASASATAADLIRQNAVLNAINDTGSIVGQKVNDPAAMVLAVGRAQATAQQNATWLNLGKVAEQALPVIRNVVEALAYALFPLVVLMLLLTSGRDTMMAFKSYAAILIWIQLWPPLYAVLNYMASVYAAFDLASAADLGTGTKVLSLQTASPIYSGAISGEAVVGYLSFAVPFIAWAAVKRIENVGSTLVGGLSGLQGALAGSTSSAAVGSVSLGNVAMDQMQLAPNRTSAFMGSVQSDASGDTFSSNVLTGRTAVSLLRNQGFASRMVSVRVSEQDVQQAGRQVDAARIEAVSATTERSAALSEVFLKGLGHFRSTRSSKGTASSSYEQVGDSLNRLDQVIQTVSEHTGLSQAQVARIAFGGSAHAGLNARIVGGEVHANADKTYQSSLSVLEQKALASMSSEQLAAFKQFGDRVSRDASFLQAISRDEREARETAARLGTTQARSERADAALADRTSFAERVSDAYERGESISIDIAQDPHNLEMFLRYAQTYGGTSAAALALMSAELARQSLQPTRVLSDGSSMPTSFRDARGVHEHQRQDSVLAPDIDNTQREHRRKAAGSGADPARPLDAQDVRHSPVRAEIQDSARRLEAVHPAEKRKFDGKARTVRTDDGTLRTKRSLLGQAMGQVGEDAGATLEDAKDAARNLLNSGKK